MKKLGEVSLCIYIYIYCLWEWGEEKPDEGAVRLSVNSLFMDIMSLVQKRKRLVRRH